MFLLFCGVGSISLPQTPRIRRLHPSTSDIGSSFRIMMFHLVFNLHCHQKCEICRNLMVACSNHSQWNQLDTEGNFNFFTTVFLGDCDHDGLHRGCAHGPHCDCARDLLHLLDWGPGTGCTLLRRLGIRNMQILPRKYWNKSIVIEINSASKYSMRHTGRL